MAREESLSKSEKLLECKMEYKEKLKRFFDFSCLDKVEKGLILNFLVSAGLITLVSEFKFEHNSLADKIQFATIIGNYVNSMVSAYGLLFYEMYKHINKLEQKVNN